MSSRSARRLQDLRKETNSSRGRWRLFLGTTFRVCGAAALLAFIGGSASRESTGSFVIEQADNPSGRYQLQTFRVEAEMLTAVCESGPLQLSIEVPGELSCVDKATVESDCGWPVAIIDAVDEGTFVKKGDVVMRLDSSNLETRAQKERIDVVEAQAALEMACERLQLQKLANESRLSAAKLDVELAELDLEKYRDGDLPRAKSAQAGVVELAREEVARSRQTFDYHSRLVAKGYESPVEVEQQRIKLRKAEFALETAQDELSLLETHVEHRDLVALQSKVERSRDELERAELESSVALRAREIDVVNREQRLKSQEDYLARLEEGIAACTVTAPRNGRVVLHKPRVSTRGQRSLAPGDVVYKRQQLFDVPRFDELEVEVKIHETLVRYVEPGQRVEVRVDARPDAFYLGEVTSVSSVPTSGSYPNYDLKVYPTVVKILADPEEVADLRPGLTARATVIADERALCDSVPAQSVVDVNGQDSVFVQTEANVVEVRPVTIGLANGTRVEITEGLAEGDEIVLSPKTEMSDQLVELWKLADQG